MLPTVSSVLWFLLLTKLILTLVSILIILPLLPLQIHTKLLGILLFPQGILCFCTLCNTSISGIKLQLHYLEFIENVQERMSLKKLSKVAGNWRELDLSWNTGIQYKIFSLKIWCKTLTPFTKWIKMIPLISIILCSYLETFITLLLPWLLAILMMLTITYREC